MKIKKLIEIYEKLLPIYKENKEFKCYGICSNTFILYDYELCKIFTPDGYYKNYIKNGINYLDCPAPHTTKGNLFRVKFMKNEIKELNQLLKKGYTDI